MAADLHQLVQSLKSKHQELAKRYHETVSQRDDAMKRVADLEYTVKEQQRDIERLSQQVEFLTVVSTAMPDRDDVEKSRAILSGLVREIDKCIKDLTD
ncbi:MAG: hypothetical protein K2G21_07850 [Muribaculaceae bacterium]|nr:hypothetical protein [Muribaculaceae bacterium]